MFHFLFAYLTAQTFLQFAGFQQACKCYGIHYLQRRLEQDSRPQVLQRHSNTPKILQHIKTMFACFTHGKGEGATEQRATTVPSPALPFTFPLGFPTRLLHIHPCVCMCVCLCRRRLAKVLRPLPSSSEKNQYISTIVIGKKSPHCYSTKYPKSTIPPSPQGPFTRLV